MNQLTQQEIYEFQRAKECHICKKSFNNYDVKCRDHCHIGRQYRGASHKKCNLAYQITTMIPCLFHNLTHYDASFILKALVNSKYLPGSTKVIPLNTEKYISFTKYIVGDESKKLKAVKIRFIDSYRFLSSSLDTLAKLLPKEKLKILKRERDFLNYTDTQFDLLRRKGVFPYDFVNSMDRLKTPHLPTKEQFHNRLTNRDITDADHSHANNVWNAFFMKTMKCYSKLYILIDVLLLADIIENFKKECFETYKIDPLHSFTAPSFSWSAMLRYTRVIFFYTSF